MSADNFIAVFSEQDSLGRDTKWYVAEGMMPDIETFRDEEQWKKSIIEKEKVFYHNRAAALEAAHDKVKEITKYNYLAVEYGVIEL